MSVNDLLNLDLMPIFLIFVVGGVIFWIYYRSSHQRAKIEYAGMEEKTENNVKVISKELGEMTNIGGTIAAPIKGYRCTFILEKEDGSRLVLKTSKSDVYEKIIVGDVGNIKYKSTVLTDFVHTTK